MAVIVYELNEVPWQILDEHVERHPEGALARLLKESATFTTHTVDEGHLSPWVTWPTMHRGVPNTEHGIANLGQDPSTFRHDPIWKIARAAGKSVGVFGALQSWPPEDPGRTGFHVPDTFAPDASCLPRRYEPFQRFNLQNARRSGRVVGGLDKAAVAALLPRLPGLGIKPRSLRDAAKQLLADRRDPRMRHRRPAFQSVLGFDVFERAWRRSRPDYASFFTNHVAGFMHRFWRAAHPEEYDHLVPGEAAYADAIAWGMELADQHVGRLLRMAPDATLIVASSMGQAAIRPSDRTRSARVADLSRLLAAVGWTGRFERRPAMEPQTALQLQDNHAATALAGLLGQLTDSTGHPLFQIETIQTSLSLTLRVSQDLLDDGQVRLPDGTTVPVHELGLEDIEAETPGTAYHIPQGIWIARGPHVQADPGRRSASALDHAPTLLGCLGVTPPSHMQGSDLLRPDGPAGQSQ